MDDVVASSSIDNSTSSTHKKTLQVGSEEKKSKIEGSDDLSSIDSKAPLVYTASDNRRAAGLFDGISTVENVSSNSETEHLNESAPLETANIVQHNVELSSSEDNPPKLGLSLDEDYDRHDATIEYQRRLLNGEDGKDEDVNVDGLQTVETGNVKDVEQREFLDSSASDTLKEQNGSLLKKERIPSESSSHSAEMLHVESHSKEKADGDGGSTIIVKQNVNKPVVFKLDMNVSQNPEVIGAEKAPEENSVSGQFVIRPTGDVLAKSTKDACTVSFSGTSGDAEKQENTQAVPNDVSRNGNTEVNTDSRKTVVSKSFTKITVNSGKAKQDTQRLQNFSLIKVGIPLAADKALNAIGMKEELRGVPGTREVNVENDDDMVVIEMIEPINNNS